VFKEYKVFSFHDRVSAKTPGSREEDRDTVKELHKGSIQVVNKVNLTISLHCSCQPTCNPGHFHKNTNIPDSFHQVMPKTINPQQIRQHYTHHRTPGRLHLRDVFNKNPTFL